jgi:transcriptional regulator with PAS, ATPase and Fis domain
MRASTLQEIQRQGLIVRDPEMRDIYEKARQVADKAATVLIQGESGTGKDCLAKFIHNLSSRKKQPFTHINCNAIPDELFESELFGYDPGSFTGAMYAGKKGLLANTNHGTVFFDEIGDVTAANQVKLLQFLQQRTITRLGGSDQQELDVRVICATNRELKQAVQDGAFREDLYYRIRVVEFVLPPLRERTDDLLGFIEVFRKSASNQKGEMKIFAADAMDFLKEQYWAGNVRELQNFVEKVHILESDELITRKMLEGIYSFSVRKMETPAKAAKSPVLTLKDAVADFEREYIANAIDQTDSLIGAATRLGIDLSTLNRKKRQYGLYKRWKK